jgi:hypothetical protein
VEKGAIPTIPNDVNRNIAAIPSVRSLVPSNTADKPEIPRQGPAMKTVAIYGLQAAMGVLAMAAGVAKLAGADVMVDAFEVLGLGSSARMMAGSIELLGGLCLLLPQAGVAGALLLASVVVGSAGMTIGQVASQVLSNGPSIGVVQTHLAVGRAGEFGFQQPAAVINRGGIDI